MDDKIILICAIGRSGSTTLELILNTIPDSNICGENNGAINHLLEFYREVKFTYKKLQFEYKGFSQEEREQILKLFAKGIKPAWFNTFEFDKIKTCVQNTIIAMFKLKETTNVWGFKEIRYDGKLNLLKEFRELFPQTKVILNIRGDIQKQSKSSWFKEDPRSLQKIKTQSEAIIEFYNSNRDFCFLNTLEKMYNKEHMEKLFQFIDCHEFFDEDKIKKILLHTKESR